MKREWSVLGLMTLLCLPMCGLSVPAQAQKGSSGGGSGNGGGSGGSVDNKGVSSSTVTFDDWGIYFNQALPRGQVTFIYSPDGTYKSMNVQVTNINVPDGTVLSVETAEQWTTATGTASKITYYPITIHQNKGTLSLSSANGDSVMFLTPAAGLTYLYVWAGPQSALMGAKLGG